MAVVAAGAERLLLPPITLRWLLVHGVCALVWLGGMVACTAWHSDRDGKVIWGYSAYNAWVMKLCCGNEPPVI